jgi:phosphate transport system protein
MSKHLEHEMDKLRIKLLSLTDMVEDSLTKAMTSFEKRDKELAKEVFKLDRLIDEVEVEIEEDCLKIFALYQPVAIDLRYLVGVLKMNNDLERIGDLSVNIAERGYFLTKRDKIKAPFDFKTMADKAHSMLKRAIDALINMDEVSAHNIIIDDKEVDSIHKEMFSKVFIRVKENPSDVECLMQYLTISRCLERIADYTTNIAEDVIYMVNGKIVRHDPDIQG